MTRRSHFDRIDLARETRGATPLAESLTAILARYEAGTGIVERIMTSQEAVKDALGPGHGHHLLELEQVYVERMIDAEKVAFDFGFSFGLVHARVQGLTSDARALATEIGELLAVRDLSTGDAAAALVALLAGVVQQPADHPSSGSSRRRRRGRRRRR